MGERTIPEILAEMAIAARSGDYKRNPGFNEDQWWVELTDAVTVGFDGYSLDDDDEEDRDLESYVVAFQIEPDSKVSFFVDLEDCLSSPEADIEYTEERYNDDVEDQLEGSSFDVEKLEAFIRKKYLNWKNIQNDTNYP